MQENSRNVDQDAPNAQSGNAEQDGSGRDLMRGLLRELIRVERSVKNFASLESARLGSSPPAAALDAVVRHVGAVNEELPIRSQHHALFVGASSSSLSEKFAALRHQIGDALRDNEGSYRATLLGLRHGLDVIAALREAAQANREAELAEWCDRIFAARAPLIEACAKQLGWFAQNPRQAVAYAHGGALGKGVSLIKLQLKKLRTTLAPASQPKPSRAA